MCINNMEIFQYLQATALFLHLQLSICDDTKPCVCIHCSLVRNKFLIWVLRIYFMLPRSSIMVYYIQRNLSLEIYALSFIYTLS